MSTNQYYTGVIKKVSPPLNLGYSDLKGRRDFYKIGIKTTDGLRLLVVLNTSDLGWSGNLNKSKIYYHRKGSNRIIKTSMAKPDHYIGTKVKLKGELHAINASERKYKLSPLNELILYLED